MFQDIFSDTLSDPDRLVFWLTTTLTSLFALFAVFAPGGLT